MTCELVNYDLCIIRNASFEFIFSLLQDDGITPTVITSWSFTGALKEQYSDPTPLMFFSMSVVNFPSASVQVTLTAEDTWTLSGNKYVYDVIANDASVSPIKTYRLLQGKATVKPGVTEP